MIGKVTYKKYRCPSCQLEQTIETNHYGEIYSGCKNCDSMVLYCAEEEAVNDRKNRSTSHAKMFKYYLNIGKAEELSMYNKIVQKNKERGYKLFSVLSKRYHKTNYSFIENEEVLDIYDKEQFQEQFVSNRGRVHLWYETIFDNKKIKEGYFIEFIDKKEA